MRRLPLMLLLAALPAGAQAPKLPERSDRTSPAEAVPLPEADPLEPELPRDEPLPRRPAPRGDDPEVPFAPRTPAPVAPARIPGNAPGPVQPVPLMPRGRDRTWSENSQFDIQGGTIEERSAVYNAAQEVRRQVITALGIPDKWTQRVNIQLESASKFPPSAAPVKFDPAQTDDGFVLRLMLLPDHEQFTGLELRRELVRAVLADLCLRGVRFNLSGADVPPPDWLLHGTMELMSYRARGRPSDVFADVLRLGHILSVEDLFEAEPDGMDSVSRTLYRVSCSGLLLMLLDQPAGPQHLSAMLPDLAVPGRDPATVLARHFPGLNVSPTSMHKWWMLQIAVLANPGVDEMLGPEASEKELAAALVLRYPEKEPVGPARKSRGILGLFGGGDDEEKGKDGKEKTEEKPEDTASRSTSSCPLAEFSRVLGRSDRKEIFLRLKEGLRPVRLHAHPLIRPVIDEYTTVAMQLAEDRKIKSVPAELERLEKIRKGIVETAHRAEDHLDWWLATQSTEPSRKFEEALKAAADAGRKIPRSDRISRYLDAVAKEYE